MHIASPDKAPEQILSNEYLLNFSNFQFFYLNSNWASAELPKVWKILLGDLYGVYFYSKIFLSVLNFAKVWGCAFIRADCGSQYSQCVS